MFLVLEAIHLKPHPVTPLLLTRLWINKIKMPLLRRREKKRRPVKRLKKILRDLESQQMSSSGENEIQEFDPQVKELKQQLKLLKPGLTHVILHPAEDTPELRDICPDWAGRTADFDVLRSKQFNQLVQNEGFVKIGYRDLRNAMKIH